MPSTLPISMRAVFMPTARARCMHKDSLNTTPSNRSMAGLRMWVLGAPFSGREIRPPATCTVILSCAPAKESRMPSSPAKSGRRGNFLIISANSAGLRGRYALSGSGRLVPSGMNVTAPAHSPPIRSSMAKSFLALIPRLRAMISRLLSSGKTPAKNPRQSLRLNCFFARGSRFPTGLKCPRGLAPRQMPRPTGQKSHHRRGHGPLALTPGDMLHHHPVLGTFYPARRIEEPSDDSPQRYKQPPPLGQMVITGGGLEALRAFARYALVRRQGNLKTQLIAWAAQPDVLINEAREMLNPVQKRLNFQLHGWSFWLMGSICCNTDRITEGQPFFHCPAFHVASARGKFGLRSGG